LNFGDLPPCLTYDSTPRVPIYISLSFINSQQGPPTNLLSLARQKNISTICSGIDGRTWSCFLTTSLLPSASRLDHPLCMYSNLQIKYHVFNIFMIPTRLWYCHSGKIWMKADSFDKSSLKSEARRFSEKSVRPPSSRSCQYHAAPPSSRSCQYGAAFIAPLPMKKNNFKNVPCAIGSRFRISS
jgi:hypothetical protein